MHCSDQVATDDVIINNTMSYWSQKFMYSKSLHFHVTFRTCSTIQQRQITEYLHHKHKLQRHGDKSLGLLKRPQCKVAAAHNTV